MGNPYRIYKRIFCLGRWNNRRADTSKVFLPCGKKGTRHIYYNYPAADPRRCFDLFHGRVFRYAGYY